MIKAVPPTRMNLGVFKGKQVAAKKGYDLLKSKADALKVFCSFCFLKFRSYLLLRFDSGTSASLFTTPKLEWLIFRRHHFSV
jgi:hypothetical protein